jgi:hypothetical protein
MSFSFDFLHLVNMVWFLARLCLLVDEVFERVKVVVIVQRLHTG